MGEFRQSIDDYHTVPQGRRPDVGPGGHLGRLRLGPDALVLLRRKPQGNPPVFFRSHAVPPFPCLSQVGAGFCPHRAVFGAVKSDKGGRRLCLPSLKGGFSVPQPLPMKLICRKLQVCNVLSPLQPYSLARVASSTTDRPAFPRGRPGSSWRSSAYAPIRPAPLHGAEPSQPVRFP